MIQQFSDSGILHHSTEDKLAAVCEERLIKDHLGYLHSAINSIVQHEISAGWCDLEDEALVYYMLLLQTLVTCVSCYVVSGELWIHW